MSEYKELHGPEDLDELRAVCGEVWHGEIIEWNYRANLVQGVFGLRWDPDECSLRARIYLHPLGRVLEMDFDKVALCRYGTGSVTTPFFAFDVRGQIFWGTAPYANTPDDPNQIYTLSRTVKWRLED